MRSLLKFLLLLTKNSKNLGAKWTGGKGKHLWSIMESFEESFKSKFECVQINVINSVSKPVLVCLVERNISVPAYFDVPFQDVLGFLIYIYIYMNTHVYNLLFKIYYVSIVKILSI